MTKKFNEKKDFRWSVVCFKISVYMNYECIIAVTMQIEAIFPTGVIED